MKLRGQEYLGYGSKMLGSFGDISIMETYYHSLQKLLDHEHEKHNLVVVSNGTVIVLLRFSDLPVNLY